ncbi:C39 family peptidase [Sporosarcina gallistercoris]|uniref:C39 family peptidase n=1 Tax=Sporosarcina gallistercoris TaxID=2762245 RepID=A0ABR8PL44_9BACL|nr:C39 family peptidase [Sporosarcina gallistercoris]MBD7908888.1 C39 family peptidase [Sporosarcina gallistercoris]
MQILKQFQGRSQYESSIDRRLRSSACGPVTVSVILNFLNVPLSRVPVNKLYKFLGTTQIGLFSWRLVHRLQKLLGTDWDVRKCSVSEALQELESGRPVAAKFDKWLSFKWSGQYEFDYHWVPVIGYAKNADDVILTIHDNGSPTNPSTVRFVSYRKNQEVLSFVKIAPVSKFKGH